MDDNKTSDEQLPNLSSFPSACNDSEHYSKCFAEFCKKSNDKIKTKQWIEEYFEVSVVRPQLASAPTLKSTTSLRVLGVGSGNGGNDVCLLLALLKTFPKIEATVIEPSHELIAQYKTLANEKKDELGGVTWIWRVEKIEEFLQNHKSEDRFDLIHMVHVLYYVDIQDVLWKLHQMLSESGHLLILQNSGETKFIQRLAPIFPPSSVPYSECVTAALRSLAIPCQSISEYKTEVDVTECFTPSSIEGGLLLDFLFNVYKLSLAVSQEQFLNILELIKSVCDYDGDKWIVNMPVSVILAKKM